MNKLSLIKDVNKLEETFREQIKGVFNKGDSVAVKLHMGEDKNQYYIKSEFIRIIVNVLNGYGLNPFLFDSIVLYRGERDTVEKYYKTAEKHGFSEISIGCPIVISDTGIDVKTENMTVHVCKELAEADGLLVISHVKGHGTYGFGGAIKNIGMGGVLPKSKLEIHQANFADTDKLLAEGAEAVLKQFEKEEVFYINFLMNIAKECDCCNDAGPIVAEDIGILFGRDIVAIDKASLDLINKQKPDVFLKLHDHDPHLQIRYAKELGAGEEDYVIS